MSPQQAEQAEQALHEDGTAITIGTKADVFRSLNSNLPLNDYHLPDFIYRADLIPAELFSSMYTHSDRKDMLSAATVRLTFDHGYPAINETSPFWEQLPLESPDAFNAFMVFLELPDKSNHENPIRLLPHIAAITGLDISRITEYAHVYYWHWRSRAYDLFIVASHRKQREQRIISIEGHHFTMAEKLLGSIIQLAEGKLKKALAHVDDEDYEDDTKLRDLIAIADTLVKVQRISVGLPSNGTSSLTLNEGTRHSNASDTFKDIAKTSSGEEATTRRSDEMDSLLASPEDLAMVQNMMTRMANPRAQQKAIDYMSSNVGPREGRSAATTTPKDDSSPEDASRSVATRSSTHHTYTHTQHIQDSGVEDLG